MITPMCHASLICRREDAPILLASLRDFAGMHLKLLPQDNHGVESRHTGQKEIEQLIQKLERIEDAQGEPVTRDPAELLSLCQRLYQGLKRIEDLQQILSKEAHAWAPFGNIRPDTIKTLKSQGLQVAFYRTAVSPVDLPRGTAWLTADPGFGVAVSADDLGQAETPALQMPVRGPDRIRERQSRLANLKDASEQELCAAATCLPALKTYALQKNDELDFLKAEVGMGTSEELSWIEGFIPTQQRPALENLAAEWGAALITREPEASDPTPTLLKQNAFVSWIQPVFSFLGVTPGYHEVDVGWSFLVFLSIFSGMIIGDAGYGLLLLVIVGGLNLFKPATRGKFANLLLLMGAATVIWGLLTGNILGISGVPAIFPSLSASADPKTTMNVCFIMGASHLTLAHLWNLWNKRKSLQAFAELGWIGSTWTMYAVTGQMVLGWKELPSFIGPLFMVSAALIVIFMTPPKAFKAQWVDHMMLPLSFVNNFVDVVSYVRLYAVGMATFALASSFNSMILDGTDERNLIANGIMMLILILGHALNFILAGMGVMVHGIRLNTLEFASHLGLTWSGIPYSPFRRRSQKSEVGSQASQI